MARLPGAAQGFRATGRWLVATTGLSEGVTPVALLALTMVHDEPGRAAAMATTSRSSEIALVAGFSGLAAAVLTLVEFTPDGTDRYVWLGGLFVSGAVAALWRLSRWPARPVVVLALSIAVVGVGYGLWLWWYVVTHVPVTV